MGLKLSQKAARALVGKSDKSIDVSKMSAAEKQMLGRGLKGGGRSKYNNKSTHIDGYHFDSLREADYYNELKLRQRAKEINDLQVKTRYELAIGGLVISTYEDDFSYVERGERVIVDVKGAREGAAYELFKIKKRLMLALLGIVVLEVS